MSLSRVRQRVRKGGHDVPEVDLRRRFLPSLQNFSSLNLSLADGFGTSISVGPHSLCRQLVTS